MSGGFLAGFLNHQEYHGYVMNLICFWCYIFFTDYRSPGEIHHFSPPSILAFIGNMFFLNVFFLTTLSKSRMGMFGWIYHVFSAKIFSTFAC